jgi:uncharacterized membrane protein
MMREALIVVSEYAILVINAMALAIVIFATAQAFIQTLADAVARASPEQKRMVGLRFSRWLVVALTFQLAADIIGTAITTDWDALGRIAVIAVIRTFLNYFLEKELRETDKAASA